MLITHAERHGKTWGREEWLVNNEKYCSKLLIVYQGRYCSYHFHKIKDEHFYVLNGMFEIEMPDETGKVQKIVLAPGAGIHVPPNTPHRFTGLEPINTLVETSTQHFEDDSYRLSPAWGKDV